jgi:multicomponent Na+:H+ antiporter subunit E
LLYSGTFFVELVKANINMMRYVYALRIDIKPGIIKVRTRLQSPLGRLALANTIALTPGSLVMELRGDTIFIHLLDIDDINDIDADAATDAIVTPFERHLEHVFG